MRNTRRKILVCAILVATSVFGAEIAYAQQFKWGLRFDTKFDNREYDAVKLSGVISSKTYFSTRIAPVVGIDIDKYHSVMGGGSFIFDMGAPLDKRDPELLLYYNFHTPILSAYAGKFERSRLVGNYSRAIYAGSQLFYDNVIEGFAVQLTPLASKFEVVLDWDGMQSRDVRESFRVLSSGEWNPVEIYPLMWLTVGYSFDGYHLASSAEALEGVVDHILANPYVGAAFERLGNVWFQKLQLSVGWVGSYDRERRGDNLWKSTNGISVDFLMQKWNVGICNRLYVGDKLYSFWGDYGNIVYKGDPFYAVSGVYNYTQLYWRPRLGEGVSLDLQAAFHFDGSHFGFQQVVRVGVSLDNGMFGRKQKKRWY